MTEVVLEQSLEGYVKDELIMESSTLAREGGREGVRRGKSLIVLCVAEGGRFQADHEDDQRGF